MGKPFFLAIALFQLTSKNVHYSSLDGSEYLILLSATVLQNLLYTYLILILTGLEGFYNNCKKLCWAILRYEFESNGFLYSLKIIFSRQLASLTAPTRNYWLSNYVGKFESVNSWKFEFVLRVPPTLLGGFTTWQNL